MAIFTISSFAASANGIRLNLISSGSPSWLSWHTRLIFSSLMRPAAGWSPWLAGNLKLYSLVRRADRLFIISNPVM